MNHTDLILEALKAAARCAGGELPTEAEPLIVAGVRRVLDLMQYDKVEVSVDPDALADGVIHFSD